MFTLYHARRRPVDLNGTRLPVNCQEFAKKGCLGAKGQSESRSTEVRLVASFTP